MPSRSCNHCCSECLISRSRSTSSLVFAGAWQDPLQFGESVGQVSVVAAGFAPAASLLAPVIGLDLLESAKAEVDVASTAMAMNRMNAYFIFPPMSRGSRFYVELTRFRWCDCTHSPKLGAKALTTAN